MGCLIDERKERKERKKRGKMNKLTMEERKGKKDNDGNISRSVERQKDKKIRKYEN